MTGPAPAPSPTGTAAPDPVNLLVRRRIRAGQDAAYETRLAEASALLARVPGHRGTGVIRPAPGEREYTLLARFDSLDSAAAWEHSPERAAWLARIEPLVDRHLSFEKQPGLEFWFTPPVSPTLHQPPRWKMTLLTLAALYPVSVGFGLLLAPAAHWPALLRSLAQMMLVVPTMTYLVMPLATRLAASWLRR